MKRHGISIGLVASLIGCQQSAPIVYVDLNLVSRQVAEPLQTLEVPSSLGAPGVRKAVSIPALPERLVAVDTAHSAKAIRDLLEAESAVARTAISERLKQYYQAEIDEFFEMEYADLAPAAQEEWKAYREKIRPIFERYAKQRGPLLVSLTVLTEFPNPEQLVKVDPESEPAIQSRVERIREFQRQIAQLDKQYELEIATVDGQTRTAIQNREEQMNARVEAKRKENNQRAEREARQQVNTLTDVLNERLVPQGAKRLPFRDGASLSVELRSTNSGFKGVPSTSRTVVLPTDIHGQLQTWLALNGYDFAGSPAGARDATQEFIKWRAGLTSKR